MCKNYISAEQFFELNGKVQRAFTNWWKPAEGDLYCTRNVYDVIDVIVDVINGKYNCIYGLERDFLPEEIEINEDLIPLLQIHQLIEFIECKGYSWNKRGNFLDVDFAIDTGHEDGWTTNLSNINLLQALFQVACKIADWEV